MRLQIFLLFCRLLGSTLFWFGFSSRLVKAQILPDATLPVNSSVTTEGNASTITGGTVTGSNLFHSFDVFSIPTGSAAYFNNALDIQNIISRVTGLSISNIDGLLRANGAANLFLLNPNGIIFGANASLNIGGSFLASTASSVNFADGTQFSATAHHTTPLLTISVPIGLQYGGNPGGIGVQGTGHNLSSGLLPVRRSSSTGLRVQPGKTLALVGGNVTLDGGILTAEGGRIDLGSVNSGLISLTPTTYGWNLGYAGVQSFQDIQLSQKALVDTSGEGSDGIQLAGRRVAIADSSVALIQNQGSQPSGSLKVNASEVLELSGTSSNGSIPSILRTEAVGFGNGGDIAVSTKQLVIQGGASIGSRTYSDAKGGNLSVNASESVQLLGSSPFNSLITSGIFASTSAFGNAGNITVSTGRFVARDGGNFDISNPWVRLRRGCDCECN